ncbi:MAG: helix-turn-helix transcriptional regulator [Firmicutes bacterium]|nr:helix-turn-helix transcriptional regulator [Bacillota bacterium]
MPRKKSLDEEQLTDTNYYILLSMVHPIHGYGIMQQVKSISEGIFEIGPASLYTSLKKMQEAGFIILIDIGESDKKVYQLTESGKELLKKDYARRKRMVEQGKIIMKELEDE